MNIDKKTRLELNTLSLEVFGSSSRWQKLITHGYEETDKHEVTEMVPSDKEGEEPKETKSMVPVSLGNNSYKQTTKYYTVENIKEFMVEQQEQIANIKVQIAKMQEEDKANKEKAAKEKAETDAAKALNEKYAGSAK